MRFTAAVRRRCLSPTFATDSRYEHPQTVRFPGVQLSLDCPLAAPNRIQSCNAAPDRFAAVRPRVDTRLTTRSNFGRITHTSASTEEPSIAPGDAALPRRYQPRARLCDSTSDAPSHASSRASRLNPVKPLELLLPPSRQRGRLGQPGAPSIDKCSLESPPPCPRLSHRSAGFQRSFAS